MKPAAPTLHLPAADDSTRCIRSWQPGAWVGVARRAIGPCTEPVDGDDTAFDTLPAQWLVALWPPQSLQQPFLRRWPVLVQLTDAAEGAATQLLLQHVPAGARLWLCSDEVDWALLAEIVLRSEPHLAPWQHRELAQFILGQRQATATAIDQHYG